jgi:hypothetical protein
MFILSAVIESCSGCVYVLFCKKQIHWISLILVSKKVKKKGKAISVTGH